MHPRCKIFLLYLIELLDLHSCVARVGSDVVYILCRDSLFIKNINVVVHIELIVGEKLKKQKKHLKSKINHI